MFAAVTVSPAHRSAGQRLALGALPPLPPPLCFPQPRPLGTPAAADATDSLIHRLTAALVLDALCLPTVRPNTVAVTTAAGTFTVRWGATACSCTCPQADGPYPPVRLAASCDHILLVLWLGADPTTWDRWGACYPALAAAWQSYAARRQGPPPGSLTLLALA